MIRVARRYSFDAVHHVPNAPAPWCKEHGHRYTVEVVCASNHLNEWGMVVDTDRLDKVWTGLAFFYVECDLNATVGGPTTVEELARGLLGDFRERDVPAESVTVWEDADRWGRAE